MNKVEKREWRSNCMDHKDYHIIDDEGLSVTPIPKEAYKHIQELEAKLENMSNLAERAYMEEFPYSNFEDIEFYEQRKKVYDGSYKIKAIKDGTE